VSFFTIQKNIGANYETDCDTLQQDRPEKEIFLTSLEKAKTLIREAEGDGIPVEER
jgi:hypothetical protein